MEKLTEIFNSEGERGKEWASRCCDAIIQSANLGSYERSRDQTCYDIFHGETNTNTFEYLTGEGEMKYPAMVRFIPIIRPLFEVLRSTEATRPHDPQVFTIDPMAVQEKQDQMYRQITDRVVSRLTMQNQRINLMRMQIDMMRQQAQQQAQADPRAMLAIQQMEVQFQQIESAADRTQQVLGEEISKAQKYFKYNYRTALEVAVTTALQWWHHTYEIEEIFLEGFDDLFIVDNEIYQIHNSLEGTDPVISRVTPLDYYYPAQSGATYLDELDWGLHVRFMSPSQILNAYPEVTQGQLAKLREQGFDSYYGDVWQRRALQNRNHTTQGTTNYADGSLYPYTGSTLASDSIPVYHTVWRVWDKVSEEKLMEEGVYMELVTDEEIEQLRKLPKYRFVSYVWECTRIGKSIYTAYGQCPFQFRDRQVMGFSYLPYVGFAYNGVDKKPYSMVWAVRDIQELYNLVHYQMELLIALAGVKGFVMDEYQMPEGMSRQEWLYYLKQGVAFIQTVKRSATGGRQSHYNQFQTIDMSITQGVEYLQGVLERLEYMMSRILGVPPQRMGEVTDNDQVATHRSAIAQSTLTTEKLFTRHRQIKKRVMNRVIDIGRILWKDGKRGQYVSGDLGQQVFNIDPGKLDQHGFAVFYADTSKESQIMERISNMAGAQYNAGNISLGQMTALYKANSLKEMESLLQEFEEIAQRRMQEVERAKAMGDSEKQKMEQQFQMQLKQTVDATKQLELQLRQHEMQMNDRQNIRDNQTDLAVAQMNNETDRYEADLNANVKMAEVKDDSGHRTVEERLELLSMRMDAMKPPPAPAQPAQGQGGNSNKSDKKSD